MLSHFSRVRFFMNPLTKACQVTLSVGFSRQEYWSGLPCPPPGDPPKSGITPTSLMSPALAGGFFTTSTTWEAPISDTKYFLLFVFRYMSHGRFLWKGKLATWLVLVNEIYHVSPAGRNSKSRYAVHPYYFLLGKHGNIEMKLPSVWGLERGREKAKIPAHLR